MFRRLMSLALLGLIALLVHGPLVAQDKKGETVPNPYYLGWKDFKKNTTATVEETTTFGGEAARNAPPGGDVKVVTYKLLSVSPQKAVVQTTVVERDFLSTIESAPTRITYPAAVDKASFEALVHDVGAKLTEGEAEVQGKKTACKIFTGTSKNGMEEITKKIVFSTTVPGGIVERVTTVKSGGKMVAETTVKLKSFKVAE